MSEDTNHINEELLIKFLLGETDRHERFMVEAWLDADANNRKQLDDYKLIWDESRKLAPIINVDEEKAWERMQQKMHPKPQPVWDVQKRKVVSFSRMAAVWITLIAGTALVALYVLKNRKPEMMVVASGQTIIKDTLPDGSIVTLNKGAMLSYPDAFVNTTREITLQGEAFFNITPDRNKPFIIKTGSVSIRVVGTSFNVRNRNGNVEVTVETGVVEVTRKSAMVKLTPKEKVLVKEQEDTLVKEAVQDKLYNYYVSKEFVCVNTPLWKLVQILNEAYGVEIVVARKEVGRLPLTTTFNNESLDNILNVISQTFNLSVTRSGDAIVLN